MTQTTSGKVTVIDVVFTVNSSPITHGCLLAYRIDISCCLKLTTALGEQEWLNAAAIGNNPRNSALLQFVVLKLELKNKVEAYQYRALLLLRKLS